MPPLGPEQGYIFRITHVDNVAWILEHGLHCQSSGMVDPGFVPIGMHNLIERRAKKAVPIAPFGTLADYVPFYFTPHSKMLYNIRTGYGGVSKRANGEIVILVSTLTNLADAGIHFVFTDGHAYMKGSNYYDDLARLDRIDWSILRARDFRDSPDDIDKSRRYQAEALIHGHLPVSLLRGIACYDEGCVGRVMGLVSTSGPELPVKVVPDWYF